MGLEKDMKLEEASFFNLKTGLWQLFDLRTMKCDAWIGGIYKFLTWWSYVHLIPCSKRVEAREDAGSILFMLMHYSPSLSITSSRRSGPRTTIDSCGSDMRLVSRCGCSGELSQKTLRTLPQLTKADFVSLQSKG